MILVALFDKGGQRRGYLRKGLKVAKGEELVPGVRVAHLKEDARRFNTSEEARTFMEALPAVKYRIVERDDPPCRRRAYKKLKVAA